MHIHTSDQEILNLGFGNYTCNWGLHMCGLYETEKERDEIIFGLLKQGFIEKHLQLYCPVERSMDDFKTKFSAFCPECIPSIEDPECLSLLSAQNLYYPNGYFSPLDMDNGLNEFYINSQKKGIRNIRATAEMSWSLEAIKGVEELMIYESRLNYFIPGKPWISICMYNLNLFSGSQIMNVLRTHPYSIMKGIINQNPYYVNPDDWLAQNAPHYINTR